MTDHLAIHLAASLEDGGHGPRWEIRFGKRLLSTWESRVAAEAELRIIREINE